MKVSAMSQAEQAALTNAPFKESVSSIGLAVSVPSDQELSVQRKPDADRFSRDNFN